jgi:hypothetical protein
MSHSRRTTRLASEGAVIVVSILLAFWIDAWWAHRQARITEVTVLESIAGEVEENRRELDRLLDLNRTQLDRIDRFLGMSPDDLRSLPQDSVIPWTSAMVITWTYDGDDSAAGLFLGSGAPVTQHAREVRSVLARWVRIVEDMEEEKATVWELGADLAGRLALYATGVADDGQGLLHQVAGRLGPELLAQLRLDDEYVAATLNKSHYQNVYDLELAEASALLDSLRALVQEGAGTPP